MLYNHLKVRGYSHTLNGTMSINSLDLWKFGLDRHVMHHNLVYEVQGLCQSMLFVLLEDLRDQL